MLPKDVEDEVLFGDHIVELSEEEEEEEELFGDIPYPVPKPKEVSSVKCCDLKCMKCFSQENINDIRQRVPSGYSARSEYYLANLTNTVKWEKREARIAGKDVCLIAWREIYGLSKYLSNKFFKMAEEGQTVVVHGNEGTKKKSLKTEAFNQWLTKHADMNGSHMPNTKRVELHEGISKKTVFDIYADEVEEELVSMSTFYHEWDTCFDHLSVRKENSFARCTLCFSFTQRLKKAKNEAEKKLIIKERSQHFKDVEKERKGYQDRKLDSVQNPQQTITITMDGMDQRKTDLPTMKRPPKILEKLDKVRTHLVGVLVHRKGNTRYSKIGYSHIDLNEYPHNTNLNLSILYQTLQDYAQTLGRTLKLQLDSASDNKNQYLIAFCGWLVSEKIFAQVHLHYLPVGHTHIDIDQMFRTVKANLSVGIVPDLPTLLEQAQKVPYMESAKRIQTVYRFTEWLTPFISTGGFHAYKDVFEICITLSPVTGQPVFHHRKWLDTDLHPISSDASTYERAEDIHGIHIFQEYPNGFPSVAKASMPDDIPKLSDSYMKTGVLDETEWWEEIKDPSYWTEECKEFDFNLPTFIEREKVPTVSTEVTEFVEEMYSGTYISKKSKPSQPRKKPYKDAPKL